MTTHTIVTDPTSPEEVTPGMLRRVAAATAIGTAVEWYDFFIYGTAAALVFNKLFFPSFEPLVGTLAALSTYAVGFIARPLGGVVFGHIGDKVGRKGALVATLLIVGIGTFVEGFKGRVATYIERIQLRREASWTRSARTARVSI
jgi:MHS family shikimate/dehydroshikimate transporter-like MFS transporter